MRILITGICGFVGSQIVKRLRLTTENLEIYGVDNFCRFGSELNRRVLKDLDVKLFHGDVRNASDFESLPEVDWLIDAAANPSVLAGIDGRTSSRQLIEHNLLSTANMLEFCRKHRAGFILLSTSRVYSIAQLTQIPLLPEGSRFILDEAKSQLSGLGAKGVNENFSTTPPLSLYGVSKRTSEDLALEYGLTFNFPVHINRCGVMAGAGQFGRPDQGIVAYWIHSWREKKALKYIGFGGHGHQVRDALHPADLADLLKLQMNHNTTQQTLANVSGGIESSFSLAELSAWCEQHFGYSLPVAQHPENRSFDIPWLILDDSMARKTWDWTPQINRESIFTEVAQFADINPEWLSATANS